MSTGIYVGEDLHDTSQAPTVEAPLSEVFRSEVAKQFYTGTLASTVYGLVNTYNAYHDPEAVEQLNNQRHAVVEGLNSIIARSPSGVIPSLTKFLGFTYGIAADPLNAAASMMAPEIVGSKAEGFLAELGAEKIAQGGLSKGAEIAAKVAPSIAKGSVEGAAAMVPYNVSHLAFAKVNQDEYNFWDAAENTLFAGGIGGLLEGAFGSFHSPVEPIVAQKAAEAAVGHGAADIKFDIDPWIKNSVLSEQSKLTPEIVDQLEKRQGSLSDEIVKSDNTIRSKIKELDSKYGTEDVSRETREMPAHNYIDLATKAFLRKHSMRTAFERALLFNPDLPDEILKGMKITREGPLISGDDKDFLKSISPQKEPEFIAQKINDLNGKRLEIETKMAQAEGRIPIELENYFNNQLRAIDKEINLRSGRMENIPNYELSDVARAHAELNSLISHHNDLLNDAEKTKALLDFSKADFSPLEGNQLKAYLGKLLAPENEVPLRPIGETLRNMAKDIPDEPHFHTENLEKTAQILQEEGLLSDEEMNEIKEADDELKRQGEYTKLLKRAMNCLSRNIKL